MSIEVSSWNLLDACSDEQDARALIGLMGEQKPDVAVFPQAYAEGQDHLMDDVQGDFEAIGYHVTHGLNEDDDGRQDRHGLMVISRESITDRADLIQLGGRAAVALAVHDPASQTEIGVWGVHLNDRSSSQRETETDSLIAHMPTLPAAPASTERIKPGIVAGTTNNMHPDDLVARALSAMPQSMLDRLPAIDPVPKELRPEQAAITARLQAAVGRFGSLAIRLKDMADGKALDQLAQAGFDDTDPQHKATLQFFQLSQILTRGPLKTVHHRVDAHPQLSPHRQVRAHLSLVR